MDSRTENPYNPREVAWPGEALLETRASALRALGEVECNTRLAITNRLKGFLSEATADLPEYIEIPRSPSQKGNDEVVASMGAWLPNRRVFFLPQRFQFYVVVSPLPIEKKYLPDTKDFVGFGAVKERLGVLGEGSLKPVLGDIDNHTLNTIIQALDIRLKDSPNRGSFEKLVAGIVEDEEESQKEKSKVLKEYGPRVRQRVLNLRDAVLEQLGDNALPEVIEDEWSRSHKIEGIRRYFLVKEGRLVRAPVVERTDIVARVAKRLKGIQMTTADMSKAKDVSTEEWVDTEFLYYALKRPYTEKYRREQGDITKMM